MGKGRGVVIERVADVSRLALEVEEGAICQGMQTASRS